MLNYPSRSAAAQGFLRRSANDIDIYVEDAARAKVWLALLRKCLPSGSRLRNVMPLGSRSTVIEACRRDQINDRPKLYIVDADFDFILQKGLPKLNHLYRIPATNLEAFVLLTNGLVPFLANMLPDQDSALLATEADAHFNGQWFPPLKRLFAVYAENEEVDGGAVTSSYHVSRLSRPGTNPWEPDLTQIALQANAVAQACRAKVGCRNRRTTQKRKKVRALPVEKVVSGKTYLFPLVENFVRHKGAYPGNSEKLMLGIIAAGGAPNAYLPRRIRSILK